MTWGLIHDRRRRRREEKNLAITDGATKGVGGGEYGKLAQRKYRNL